MEEGREPVSDNETLFEICRKNMPSPVRVIDMAMERRLVAPNDTAEYMKANFSFLVERLQVDAYNIYLEEEKKAGSAAMEDYIKHRVSEDVPAYQVASTVSSMFGEFDRFFLSLTQSRRSRAGIALEVILRTLFLRLGYPFDEQQVINGKPDFLMPSRKYYDANPMDCIIFTAKRSLRERWRQIVTEGTRGLGFYLATIDEGVSEPQLREMLANRIYMVIPERLKREVAAYTAQPNVISFETFIMHHLDPAMARWRAGGVI